MPGRLGGGGGERKVDPITVHNRHGAGAATVLCGVLCMLNRVSKGYQSVEQSEFRRWFPVHAPVFARWAL